METWHPRPVLIPVDQFMEKDHDKQFHWIEIDKRMVIQGLIVEMSNSVEDLPVNNIKYDQVNFCIIVY